MLRISNAYETEIFVSSKEKNIDTDVLRVLSSALCEENRLQLPEQLDRKLYMKTNDVLAAVGGKWNKKAKAHLFDGLAAEIIEQTILTGTYTRMKQDLGQFDTPDELAQYVVERADILPHHMVLEPSAGVGQLVKYFAKNFCVLVEKDPKRVAVLRETFPNTHTVEADFLEESLDPNIPEGRGFDRVVMNPPFANRADIHHIRHAFTFLGAGGKLTAIASAGITFRNDRLGQEFRAFVYENGGMIETLPEEAFKASGTLVRTVLVQLNKS